MSHRLTIKTDINDPQVLAEALKDHDIDFVRSGSQFRLRTGAYDGTTINVTDGSVVSADVDNVDVNQKDIGILRQWYSERQYRNSCLDQGVDITNRQEAVEGGRNVVILSWQTS